MKFTQLAMKTFLTILLIVSTDAVIGQAINYQQSSTPPTVFSFETVNIPPVSQRGAFYSHLWWFSDNGFSFADQPHYVYQRWGQGPIKAFAISTENYGTGGPPPAILDTIVKPLSGDASPTRLLAQGNSIYMQRYRNAVVGDDLYLIITYSLPSSLSAQSISGDLRLQVDPTTTLLTNLINSNPEFTPNNETLSSGATYSFTNLQAGEERSILVPINTGTQAEELVSFRVDMILDNPKFQEGAGISYYEIEVDVAKSHDPNNMIENSEAEILCDFGGEPIEYIVNFQNNGDAATYFVSTTSFLDDKIDMNSISSIVLPKEYGSTPVVQGALNGHYVQNAGAIYDIDKANRTITFEFNDLVLRSVNDPSCNDLELTRSKVEFTVKMKPNYKFGDPVIAYTSIVFDENDAMLTDSVYTVCGDPLPMNNGGGFYGNTPTIMDTIKEHWILALIIGLGLIVVLIAGIKRFRKG